MRLHVINGPNLNLLGSREPEVYGKETLADIEKRVSAIADKKFEVKFFQHDTEGELVSYVQKLKKDADIAIINAAAYTHTSIALRDALSAVGIDFVEVHISNVYKREIFRHHSYLSDISGGVIVGLGTAGYDLAAAHFVKKYS